MNDLTYDISKKDVVWMQEQYRSKFGMELDAETAYRNLHLLVRQMEILYQPVTKGQVEALMNEDKYHEQDSH